MAELCPTRFCSRFGFIRRRLAPKLEDFNRPQTQAPRRCGAYLSAWKAGSVAPFDSDTPDDALFSSRSVTGIIFPKLRGGKMVSCEAEEARISPRHRGYSH